MYLLITHVFRDASSCLITLYVEYIATGEAGNSESETRYKGKAVKPADGGIGEKGILRLDHSPTGGLAFEISEWSQLS